MKALKDDITEDRETVLSSLTKTGVSYTDAMKSVSANYIVFTTAHEKCGLPYKIDYLYSSVQTMADALEYQKEHAQDKRSKPKQTSDELLKDVVKYLKDNLLADKYNASTSNTNPAQIAGTIANIVEYIDKKHSAVK